MKTKTEHTPTPWEFQDIYDKGVFIQTTKGAIRQVIAEVFDGSDTGGEKNQLANAEFITRACNAHEEILACLKEAVKYLQYEGYYDMDKFHKAIAKAEGSIA